MTSDPGSAATPPTRVLIAEDDPVSRRLLEGILVRSGYEVVTTGDGAAAWRELSAEDAPRLAILDWMMPGLDGVEVTRRIREKLRRYVYVLLLTARGEKDDVVAGLDSGADDYLTKPFHPHELRSRLEVGERILNLQSALEAKVCELQEALAHVKQLQGLLPICMHCKKIRDVGDSWHRLETYIQDHSGAMFTHSLCQDCLEQHYPEVRDRQKGAPSPVGE